MSLASTASAWTNDNIQTRKRIPTIRRTTAKIRPYNEPITSNSYISTESNYQNMNTNMNTKTNANMKMSSMEETEQENISSSLKINDMLNKITSMENDGNKLSNFQPLDNTKLNTRRQPIEDENKYEKDNTWNT